MDRTRRRVGPIGPLGVGKTDWALEAVFVVARGREARGAMFVLLEGRATILNRIEKACAAHRIALDEVGLSIVEEPLDLRRREAAISLIQLGKMACEALARPVPLIVIDAISKEDVQGADDMAAIVQNARHVAELLKAHVLLSVHDGVKGVPSFARTLGSETLHTWADRVISIGRPARRANREGA